MCQWTTQWQRTLRTKMRQPFQENTKVCLNWICSLQLDTVCVQSFRYANCSHIWVFRTHVPILTSPPCSIHQPAQIFSHFHAVPLQMLSSQGVICSTNN